ncbi:MAG: hypothetical protein CL868_08785 [Cytophagaceae bacterium]|nr:hypothetical protein [Cytophagaceae bacterium]|tara:strand:+ start:6939 stop:7544 length:606 start_codon:yes stop_codon:yes gene_type:complete
MRLLIVFILLASPVCAQEELNFWERRDMARILGTISERPETITVDFTLHKISEKDTTTQDGLFFYMAPDKLKCELIDAPRQEWVINDNLLTIEENQKEVNYDLERSSALLPAYKLLMDIINGVYLDDSKYVLDYMNDFDSHIFGIKPREGPFKSMEIYLYFEKSLGIIKSIRLVENNKAQIIIDLKMPIYNTPIHESAFKL